MLDGAAIREHAARLVEGSTSARPPAGAGQHLSGGNKQKVVIARELSRPVVLLIAAQPTRGVDVGSIEFIHKTIVAQRDRRAAVLLVSTELDEILSLSDRIAVMYEGEIVAEYGDDASDEACGIAMTGGTVKGEAAA